MLSNKDPVVQVQVNHDEDGEIASVTIDGVAATEGERPSGTGTVLYSVGSDPENGHGIEIVDFATTRCYHYFCRWICT